MPAVSGDLGGRRAKSMDDENMQTPSEKIQLMLDDVKTIIDRKGNYPLILIGIRGIEKISKQEGLKVPEGIPELRKKAYALQSERFVDYARYHVRHRRPHDAMSILKSAEAYARMAGSSVPKGIYELRELIIEKSPSTRTK